MHAKNLIGSILIGLTATFGTILGKPSGLALNLAEFITAFCAGIEIVSIVLFMLPTGRKIKLRRFN